MTEHLDPEKVAVLARRREEIEMTLMCLEWEREAIIAALVIAGELDPSDGPPWLAFKPGQGQAL